jgi:hypothetical protein
MRSRRKMVLSENPGRPDFTGTQGNACYSQEALPDRKIRKNRKPEKEQPSDSLTNARLNTH